MEHFTRYFVRDDEGEVESIYDGDDDRQLAIAHADDIGGTVWALDYVSNGQFQKVVE